MNSNNSINFMRYRSHATLISAIIVIISLFSLATRGLHLGLDFTGGTQVELQYKEPVNLPATRQWLKEIGYQDAVIVAFSGYDISLRTKSNIDKEEVDKIITQLKSKSGSSADISVQSIEYLGPQIGEELREDGGLGMLAALLVVMLYVAVRFQYKFSVGAVLALFHDVIVTLGLFSLFRWDFDLTVLAAILAVIGYSLNDTIVIFDRIRENFKKSRQLNPMETINLSLTQTFERTLITSLTTLVVLLVLFIAGGEAIHNFSLALIIGVLVGTYSSIYVASNTLLRLHLDRKDLLPKTQEDKDIQTML